MRDLERSLLGLALAAAAAGCAPHRPASTPPADSAAVVAEPLADLVLEIENHNWSDVVVYVLHDGRTSRLTQVTAGRSVSLPLLPRLVGAMGVLRLAVHPIGGSSDYTSDLISLRTGSTVRLTVESTVSRSSVAVW